MSEVWVQSSKLRARVDPRGATLVGLRWAEGDMPLILEPVHARDPLARAAYTGAVVGPVANRIASPCPLAHAKLPLPINEPPNVCLHGGPAGLHAHEWAVSDQSEASVTLALSLKDGACGLPGDREIECTYALSENTLTLTLTARTDAATLFAPAHHPYWSLGTENAIEHLKLLVVADDYLPVTPQNLPTGTSKRLATTRFDLRAPTLIPFDTDHCFCLSHAPHPTPRFAATLSSPNGFTLSIDTTEPGLQVYAGAGLPEMDASDCIGPRFAPGAGIALEPQYWPNAPHHADFLTPVLHPGHRHHQITRYRINR